MTAALHLAPAVALRASLAPLLDHVRRDPRLAHARLSVGGDAEIDLSFSRDGLRLRVGSVDVGELPVTAAARALSHLFQSFLAEGWSDPSVGAFAARLGGSALRERLGDLR